MIWVIIFFFLSSCPFSFLVMSLSFSLLISFWFCFLLRSLFKFLFEFSKARLNLLRLHLSTLSRFKFSNYLPLLSWRAINWLTQSRGWPFSCWFAPFLAGPWSTPRLIWISSCVLHCHISLLFSLLWHTPLINWIWRLHFSTNERQRPFVWIMHCCKRAYILYLVNSFVLLLGLVQNACWWASFD